MTNTVRVNFTIPENIAADLKKRISKSRRSAFVAEAVKQRLEEIKKVQLEKELKEGYQARREENIKTDREWEQATLGMWDS